MLSDPLSESRRAFVSDIIPSMLSTPASARRASTHHHVSERKEERNHPWWWHNTKIQCLFARVQYLLVWVERQIYFVMFSLVENRRKTTQKLTLFRRCVYSKWLTPFRRIFFPILFFRKDRENKLWERERKTIKKKRELNMANRLGCWKQPHSMSPHQITHHFRHFPPGSEYARRENWIFRLSKPHKPVARVSGTFLVAFFVQKWTLILLSNLTFHSTCKKGPECVGNVKLWNGPVNADNHCASGRESVDDQNA